MFARCLLNRVNGVGLLYKLPVQVLVYRASLMKAILTVVGGFWQSFDNDSCDFHSTSKINPQRRSVDMRTA